MASDAQACPGLCFSLAHSPAVAAQHPLDRTHSLPPSLNLSLLSWLTGAPSSGLEDNNSHLTSGPEGCFCPFFPKRSGNCLLSSSLTVILLVSTPVILKMGFLLLPFTCISRVSWHFWHLRLNNLLWGCLCIVWCLAAFLASTH